MSERLQHQETMLRSYESSKLDKKDTERIKSMFNFSQDNVTEVHIYSMLMTQRTEVLDKIRKHQKNLRAAYKEIK